MLQFQVPAPGLARNVYLPGPDHLSFGESPEPELPKGPASRFPILTAASTVPSVLPVHDLSSTAQLCLNRLSHARGQVQAVSRRPTPDTTQKTSDTPQKTYHSVSE